MVVNARARRVINAEAAIQNLSLRGAFFLRRSNLHDHLDCFASGKAFEATNELGCAVHYSLNSAAAPSRGWAATREDGLWNTRNDISNLEVLMRRSETCHDPRIAYYTSALQQWDVAFGAPQQLNQTVWLDHDLPATKAQPHQGGARTGTSVTDTGTTMGKAGHSRVQRRDKGLSLGDQLGVVCGGTGLFQ